MSSQIFSLMKYYGKVSIVHYMSKHERKLANAFTKMGYTRDKTIIFQIWVTSTPIYFKSIFYIRHQTKFTISSYLCEIKCPYYNYIIHNLWKNYHLLAQQVTKYKIHVQVKNLPFFRLHYVCTFIIIN